MNISECEYEYYPQLSKYEYDQLIELHVLGKLEVEIGVFLSENSYLDEEDATNLVGNAFAQLFRHYYPALKEKEHFQRAMKYYKQRGFK